MSKQYKVWLHIEEIDEDEDTYEDVREPIELGTFDTVEEAEAFAAKVEDAEHVTDDEERANGPRRDQ